MNPQIEYLEYLSDPQPGLSPVDVLRLVLDSLQNDDLLPRHGGVALAYRFASPRLRQTLASEAALVDLLALPPYAALIGFEWAEMRLKHMDAHEAVFRVRIHRRDARAVVFHATLTRQTAYPHEQCWMLDCITPETGGY